jgi:hypothetical protein
VPARIGDGDRRAERVSDQNRTVESHALLEGVHEVDPSAQRVGTLPLGVAERREVKREDSMVVAESAADAFPDGARTMKPPSKMIGVPLVPQLR